MNLKDIKSFLKELSFSDSPKKFNDKNVKVCTWLDDERVIVKDDLILVNPSYFYRLTNDFDSAIQEKKKIIILPDSEPLKEIEPWTPDFIHEHNSLFNQSYFI